MAASVDPTTLHVRRARDGDPASVGFLVERFTPLLLEQARFRMGARLRRELEPEDLVGEVWAVTLGALGNLGEDLEPGRRLTPVVLRFLSTTLLFRVSHHLRRLAVRGASEGAGDSEPGRPEPAAEVTGIVTRVGRDERRAVLAAALDALSDRDREVVVLRGLEQRGNAEVAELLGESPNAVSLRYNRALAGLRRALGPSAWDELAEEVAENPDAD